MLNLMIYTATAIQLVILNNKKEPKRLNLGFYLTVFNAI